MGAWSILALWGMEASKKIGREREVEIMTAR